MTIENKIATVEKRTLALQVMNLADTDCDASNLCTARKRVYRTASVGKP